jgi:hypothetical protein
MIQKLDPKEVVSFEHLLMSNVIEQEALINLLQKRGIIRKEELLEEIKRLRDRKMKIRMGNKPSLGNVIKI